MPESKQLNDTKKTQIKNWLKLAEAKHKDRVKKNTDRFLKRLDQEFNAQTDDEHQSIFNYYHVNTRRIVPELLPKEIKIKIRPKEGRETLNVDGAPFDNKLAAIILDKKVNSIFTDNKTKYTLKAGIIDLLVANLSTIIVGQQTEMEEKEIIPDGTKNLLEEKKSQGEEIPGEEPVPVKEKKFSPPELVIMRESFQQVMVDPDSVDFFFSDKKYAVRYIKRTKEEAKKLYPQFTNIPTETTDLNEKTTGLTEGNPEAQKVKEIEVYDYTGDTVKRYRFLNNTDNFIDEADFDYDPLALCKLNYIPDETYPASDFKYYEPLVDEANYYRTVEMNQLDRNAARKLLFDKNAVDEEDAAKFIDSDDLDTLGVDAQNRRLEDVATIWQPRDVSNDWQEKVQTIEGQIEIMSTVNSLALGNVPKTPATNASIASQSFRSGNEERKDILKDYIAIIVEKVIHVLKKISLKNESFRVEFPNGVIKEVEWNKKDIIHAQVEVEVEFEAGIPDDIKAKRLQDYAGWVLQPQIQQMLAAQGKKIDVFKFVQEIGKYFVPDALFDKLIVDDDATDTPDREMLLMMAGQPVEPSRNEDFKEHLEAHMAFMQKHPIFQQLPMEIKELFVVHIAQTQRLMAEQEELKKPQQTNARVAGDLAGGAQNVQ